MFLRSIFISTRFLNIPTESKRIICSNGRVKDKETLKVEMRLKMGGRRSGWEGRPEFTARISVKEEKTSQVSVVGERGKGRNSSHREWERELGRTT